MRITRRHLQLALGALWLLDGVLQLQPFMFTAGFATDVVAPAGAGQPGWVAGPVAFFAAHIGAHAALVNTAFALGQIGLGLGFLARRTVRPAVLASIAWALSVWWLGEGLGGLASGHASLITGAPGAVILYAVLAVAAWPGRDRDSDDPQHLATRWLTRSWVLVWAGGAVLQVLPAQNRASVLAGQVGGGADGAPGWLATLDRTAAGAISHGGTIGMVGLAAVLAAAGLGALGRGPVRTAALVGGGVLAALFWLVGQNLGQLYTGHSTDPNSGPLLVLLAAAAASAAPVRTRHADRTRRYKPGPLIPGDHAYRSTQPASALQH